ncbi:MAG: hypothetical protein GY869_15220 [Planctomycetes bacterium]|nr:hypothetical protein [Planctomycetota bacterium]
MTITSQAGLFAYGINEAGLKGGAVATWHRHKALMVGLSSVLEKEMAPPEISGPNNPTGAYKSGHYFGGRLSVQPRLENAFGWFLLGALGYVSSAANATTGFTHTFSQKPDVPIFIPFMGFRKLVPALTDANKLAEVGEDCVISTMVFNFPQAGPISADMDILGRNSYIDDTHPTWTFNNIPEAYQSVPMSMKGSGLILPNWGTGGGLPLPITNARITINNNTTNVREERIIGSYIPDDFATRQRSVTIEATYKWKDPELYRLVWNSNAGHGNFQPCIEFTDMEISVESPCDIEGGVIDFPWRLVFQAPNVDWRTSPVQLAGDEIVTMDVVGTAIEAPSGLAEDYFQILLENAVSGYPLP